MLGVQYSGILKEVSEKQRIDLGTFMFYTIFMVMVVRRIVSMGKYYVKRMT